MSAAVDPRTRVAQRGYQPAYHPGDACPACDHRGWLVGRRSAQCGRCATALPLAPLDLNRG